MGALIVKYAVGALIVIVLFVGYYINKSNKEDMVRLKQAESEQKQKIIDAQAILNQEVAKKELKDATDIKIKELQSKYMMDYLEAKKVVESPKITIAEKKFYVDLAGRWSDAFSVAGSTSRIALSQPVKDMQQIKRDLESHSPKTDCEAKMKQELLKSYDFSINGFLQFMQKNEDVSNLFISMGSDHQRNATALIDYC